jgi:hypothetical protein
MASVFFMAPDNPASLQHRTLSATDHQRRNKIVAGT